MQQGHPPHHLQLQSGSVTSDAHSAAVKEPGQLVGRHARQSAAVMAVSSTPITHAAGPPSQEGQPAPPQSTPVSVPFFTPSVQEGGWHVPLEHTRPRQSVPMAHCCTVPHEGHEPPPQSTSVSEPFITRSVQEGGLVQKPTEQTPL